MHFVVDVDRENVDFAAKPKVVEGFRHARARMWPAWYYLIELRATGKFDMRARAARVASWDRNVENVLVFFLIS